MGLRGRIMFLVAIGLLAATAPVGVMGLAMVRAATDQILQERLATASATAEHLGERVAQGWEQLNQLSGHAAQLWTGTDPAPIRQYFATVAPQMSLFSGGVFLVDRAVHLIFPEPGSPLRALTPFDASVLGQLFATGQPAASGLVRTREGVPAVLFAVPVFSGPGRVIGAVGGVIDLTKPVLSTFIDGLALGATGHAVIVSQDGTVLASTNRTELFTREEHPEFFRALIAGGRALVGPTDESDRGGKRGETHVMAFAPLAAVPWGIGFGQSDVEIFGPIRRLRDRIMAFEVLALAAALVFAWLDTSAVVAPLRLLKVGAERIAGGDLTHPVEVRRGDELGMLAGSFETMRQQLQRSLQENARLQDRVLSVMLLEERERIAREMHDSVGQVLGYVNTKAQAVKTLLEASDTAGAQRQLTQLEQAARNVYTDLREAILSLRTATSPGMRLVPALKEYVDRFSELSGIRAELTNDSAAADIVLSPTAELHLVRIIGEALTNVRKHAGARRAWVRLAGADGALVATVTDDGVGFDADQITVGGGKGFGLQTMRERAEAIGAGFAVRSTGGVGTEVEIRLPLPERRVNDARPAGR